MCIRDRGALVRVADLRSYHALWGDTSFVAELPILEEQQGPEQDSEERQTAENGAAPSPTQEVEAPASATPEPDQTVEPSPTACLLYTSCTVANQKCEKDA